jgi:hypothetical protein
MYIIKCVSVAVCARVRHLLTEGNVKKFWLVLICSWKLYNSGLLCNLKNTHLDQAIILI